VVRLFGVALVLAGFLPVFSFVCRALAPQAPLADLAAEIRLTWLPQVLHTELAFALLGVAVMALGAIVVARQRPVLAAARRRKEDAARRIPQYRDATSSARSLP
jgi:hypothetical protein